MTDTPAHPHPQSRHLLKEGTSILIRPITLADAQPLLTVLDEVIGEEIYLLMEPGELNMNLDEELRWIYRIQQSENQLYLVAQSQQDTALLGGLSLMALSQWRYAHIRRLGMFIHPDWRGKGLGKALLKEALTWARSQASIEKIVLEVFAHNQAAIALYRQAGFVPEGTHPRQVKTLAGQYFEELSMGLLLS